MSAIFVPFLLIAIDDFKLLLAVCLTILNIFYVSTGHEACHPATAAINMHSSRQVKQFLSRVAGFWLTTLASLLLVDFTVSGRRHTGFHQ